MSIRRNCWRYGDLGCSMDCVCLGLRCCNWRKNVVLLPLWIDCMALPLWVRACALNIELCMICRCSEVTFLSDVLIVLVIFFALAKADRSRLCCLTKSIQIASEDSKLDSQVMNLACIGDGISHFGLWFQISVEISRALKHHAFFSFPLPSHCPSNDVDYCRGRFW